MAVETSEPLTASPHRAFASATEAYDELQNESEAFNWHLHAPVLEGRIVPTVALRRFLLELPSPELTVSAIFPPQGPHNYRYFSAYFPGSFLSVIQSLLILHREVPVMLHPETGFQFAEHQEPSASFHGATYPNDAIDYEFLKRHDEDRKVDTSLPVLAP